MEDFERNIRKRFNMINVIMVNERVCKVDKVKRKEVRSEKNYDERR